MDEGKKGVHTHTPFSEFGEQAAISPGAAAIEVAIETR